MPVVKINNAAGQRHELSRVSGTMVLRTVIYPMPPPYAPPVRLRPADAERYVRLRQRMLDGAPWAFAASPEDDVALDPGYLAELLPDEHHATFAIEAPDLERSVGETPARRELIAAASITRAKGMKYAHRARLWGVFVDTAHRGKGLGRAVLTAAIGYARGWPGVDFIDLGVNENSPEVQRLYEKLGFEAWGREPEALEYEGRRYDEIHMTLRLHPAPPVEGKEER